MTTIRLHGRIGKIFGREFSLAVNTPAEAIRALCRLLPGFQQHLVQSGKNGVVYRFLAGKTELSVKELSLSFPSRAFDLFPIPAGSKRAGVFQVVLGAILVAAAVVTAGSSLGLTSLVTKSAWVTAFGSSATFGVHMAAYMGAAMFFGGISTLIANPKMDSYNGGVTGDSSRSYIFNGSNQTTRQGGPVPVGYGTLHIGGQVVSMSITTDNEHIGVYNAGESALEIDDDGRETYRSTSTSFHVGVKGANNNLGGVDYLGRPMEEVEITDSRLPHIA